MGKSAFVGAIAEHAAVGENMGVAFFSIEMSAVLLTQRFLCSLAKVSAHKLRRGFLSSEDWPHLLMAAEKLSQAPLFIDETPAINVFGLRAKARRLKSNYDIKLLMVDYLQLIRSTHRAESRQQEISEISRALKALAKEINVPILAVSQLSREVEKRTGHRPQLSDLRESGAIEQDADVVIFLFREEYYNPTPDNEGIAEVIIAKQRNGPTDTIKVGFIKEYMSFVSLAKVTD
jgi:replicative DNA helicase